MRKKLKKRFTKKVKAAFKEENFLKECGITRAYISGVNSKPLMSKNQAITFCKYLESEGNKRPRFRDLMNLSPVVYGVSDE